MFTEVIDLKSEFERGIALGAKLIQSGETVAFPTETVYGLGADALNSAAVEKIFIAKGRPADNPLIVHVAGKEDLRPLVSKIPAKAVLLIDAFWPGPLTLVLQKSNRIPAIVSAGLDTVGVRMPDNKAALELIRMSGSPVAAPSANKSGKPSPTEAEHVFNDLKGNIPLILDGGACRHGIESTVLSLAGEPELLRPGAVTLEMLESVLGKVKVSPGIFTPLSAGEKAASPGLMYKHYAPDAEVTIVGGEIPLMAEKICELYDLDENSGKRTAILMTTQTQSFYGDRLCVIIGDRENTSTICAQLFSALRELEAKGTDAIYIEALPTQGVGMAYMNRALRAAGFNFILA